MAFVAFEMERYQSTWEHHVDLNLSESGVHPATLGELMELTGIEHDELATMALEYIQSNGGSELRQNIAAFHPGAGVGNVLVTSGSAEANFLATWELCEAGDEIVFMQPNYFQIHGVAENFGAEVKGWWLQRNDTAWALDLQRLQELVSERTRMIVVTSPNNPTGARFDVEAVEGVIAAARRVGAWIVSDEVYRGAEMDGQESIGFWGRYERLVVTGGLSKAYALPGLRIGWAVTSAPMAEKMWSRKDYTTISPGAINAHLATGALQSHVRDRLLARTQGILRNNWPILEAWLSERDDCFDWIAPQAGAIAFVRYDLPLDSLALAEKVRAEAGCLLVPGAHFQMPDYLRIGFGPPAARLREGLERLARVVDPLRASRPS